MVATFESKNWSFRIFAKKIDMIQFFTKEKKGLDFSLDCGEATSGEKKFPMSHKVHL